MKSIKILIADPVDSSRAHLKSLIEHDKTLDIVGEARDDKEIMEKIIHSDPEVVVIDWDIEDGEEVIRQITLQYPRISVIVVSDRDDLTTIKAAMLSGSKEYLVKPLSPGEVASSIKKVVDLNRQREKLLRKDVEAIARESAPAPRNVNRLICVYGTKGGVGKSVICTNLAVTMGKKYKGKVSLVDLDLQFGDTCILMDLNPRKTIAELMQEGDHIDEDLVEDYMYERNGVNVLAPPNKPEMADLVTADGAAKILKLCHQMYNFTFIDTPSFIDETTLTALEMADIILLVISLDLPTIKNVKKGLDVLKALNFLPKTRLILNRSSGVAGIEAMDVEKILDMKIKGEVPSDGKLVVSSVNKGIPFVKLNPKASISKGMEEICDLIESWGLKNKEAK